jgi:enterochelin esterase-like enzyme
MLPGNIHTDSIWDELGLDEAAEAGILATKLPPLMIVMADGGWIASNSSGGPGSYETVILAELIPFIESRYCAWAEANGRALGGLSRGGYWALEIAFRHPEQFASVGGHSAALYDIAAGPALNPQHTGINNDLGDLRIYFDIGAEDYLIPNIRQLHQAMTAAAIDHTWVLNSGQHNNAYWSAHVADYLAWYTIPWSFTRETYPLCQH